MQLFKENSIPMHLYFVYACICECERASSINFYSPIYYSFGHDSLTESVPVNTNNVIWSFWQEIWDIFTKNNIHCVALSRNRQREEHHYTTTHTHTHQIQAHTKNVLLNISFTVFPWCKLQESRKANWMYMFIMCMLVGESVYLLVFYVDCLPGGSCMMGSY